MNLGLLVRHLKYLKKQPLVATSWKAVLKLILNQILHLEMMATWPLRVRTILDLIILKANQIPSA